MEGGSKSPQKHVSFPLHWFIFERKKKEKIKRGKKKLFNIFHTLRCLDNRKVFCEKMIQWLGLSEGVPVEITGTFAPKLGRARPNSYSTLASPQLIIRAFFSRTQTIHRLQIKCFKKNHRDSLWCTGQNQKGTRLKTFYSTRKTEGADVLRNQRTRLTYL